jgi:hypothetical protein
MFVDKPDDQIVLPDLTMNVQKKEVINRKSFTKGAEKAEASALVEENK